MLYLCIRRGLQFYPVHILTVGLCKIRKTFFCSSRKVSWVQYSMNTKAKTPPSPTKKISAGTPPMFFKQNTFFPIGRTPRVETTIATQTKETRWWIREIFTPRPQELGTYRLRSFSRAIFPGATRTRSFCLLLSVQSFMRFILFYSSSGENAKVHIPSLTHVYVYTVYLFTQGRGEGGRVETEWRLEGQQFTNLGQKYQHDWLYLQSINSDKHLPQKSFYRSIFFIRRHFALVSI
jgi:hypothetical protein